MFQYLTCLDQRHFRELVDSQRADALRMAQHAEHRIEIVTAIDGKQAGEVLRRDGEVQGGQAFTLEIFDADMQPYRTQFPDVAVL
ncbi:hypothetical protein D3C71_1725380 [compost metagenome]